MILASSGHESALYVVLVILHVIVAVVGFGAVAISGAYGGTARHLDRVGAPEEARRYFASHGPAEWAVLAVPVFGLAAVAAAPGPSQLGSAWVGGALGVWLVAAVVLTRVVRPAERTLRALLAPSPPVATDPNAPNPTEQPAVQVDPADLASEPAALSDADAVTARRAGRALLWGAATCDIVFGVALLLMIFRP